MGGHPRVLFDWLIGGVVYIVYLCPPYSLQPPRQTHDDCLRLEKPGYHADVPALQDSLPVRGAVFPTS